MVKIFLLIILAVFTVSSVMVNPISGLVMLFSYIFIFFYLKNKKYA